MNKDIYELLNNGDFHEEEYENVYKKDFNDLEIKNIKKFVKKNSKAKSKNKAIKIGVAAAACILMLGICNTTIRTEVLASVSNIISKIDPNKNYESDYVVELNDSYSKNGVEIKLDRCDRNFNMVSLVYTMNFEDGVPESIKGKTYTKTTEAYNGESVEEIVYENDGLEGVKITVNGNDDYKETGIKYCYSEDIKIEEKSITKKVIFILGDWDGEGKLLDERRLKEDLNIKIEYDKIINNSGKEIKGPWVIEYKVEAESEAPKIKETKLDKDYGYTLPDGKIVTIDSYVITNTDIKIFGTELNCNNDIPIICLSGVDNLGNKIIMTPFCTEKGEDGTRKIEFRLSQNQASSSEGSYLEKGIDSFKVSLHAFGPGLPDPEPGQRFSKVGEEFTVNVQ